MPASIRMRVTPVSVSPFRMVASIGDGPRYLGSNDGWIFMRPFGNISIICWLMILPYATTIPASGLRFLISFSTSDSFCGWRTGISLANPRRLTAGKVNSWPRPAWLSGLVIMAMILQFSESNWIKAGTLKASVPKKISLSFVMSGFLGGCYRDEFAVRLKPKEFLRIFDAIIKDNAVGVVDLVLKDAGQKAGGSDSDLPAF